MLALILAARNKIHNQVVIAVSELVLRHIRQSLTLSHCHVCLTVTATVSIVEPCGKLIVTRSRTVNVRTSAFEQFSINNNLN